MAKDQPVNGVTRAADGEWNKDDAHIPSYTLCHQKLASENELTNQRLSWNFAIQGFLFAAYAVCLQTMAYIQIKLADISKTDSDRRVPLEAALQRIEHTVDWIPVAGYSVSLFVFLGAIAAHVAIWSGAVIGGKSPNTANIYPD